MGLVLDSSVIVFAERQELPVSSLLDRLQKQHSVNRNPKRSRYLDAVFASIRRNPLPVRSATLSLRNVQ